MAELGDITRFTNPRQLMAYLGLVPSEHSSGRTRRQGGITKAGNGAARRMLIEAAWSYRFPARISPRAAAAAGATGQADPRHRMESSGAAVPTVSQARPGRKVADGDHCRDRARAGGLHLGDRQTGTAHGYLNEYETGIGNCFKERTHHATTHPMLGKAGGTVTARRTLEGTISRISSDAGH